MDEVVKFQELVESHPGLAGAVLVFAISSTDGDTRAYATAADLIKPDMCKDKVATYVMTESDLSDLFPRDHHESFRKE